MDAVQRPGHTFHALGDRPSDLVDDQGFQQRPQDRKPRVQCLVRILEYELRLPPVRQEIRPVQPCYIAPGEPDAAGRGVQQLEDELGGRGFAAPALPGQAQATAFVQDEGDAVDRVDDTPGTHHRA